jgi:hypothetical protein
MSTRLIRPSVEATDDRITHPFQRPALESRLAIGLDGDCFEGKLITIGGL